MLQQTGHTIDGFSEFNASSRVSRLLSGVFGSIRGDLVNLEQFRKYARRAFRFLVEDFGFSEVPLPKGEFVNQYMVCFSSDYAWVGASRASIGGLLCRARFAERTHEAPVQQVQFSLCVEHAS